MSRNLRHLLLFSLLGASAWVIGCGLDECETTADCEADETCVIESGEETGTCEGPDDNGTTDAGGGGGADTGGGGGADTGGGGTDTGGEPDCDPDGICGEGCGTSDVDCNPACTCDESDGFCDNSASGSTTACSCDTDCSGRTPCADDDFCDTSCPDDADPNCDCACDYNQNVCEARSRGTTVACECDFDCADGGVACGADDHCDTFCPDATDPDCTVDPDPDPVCRCDYNEGICEVASRGSSTECACDADCVGADPCKSDSHCDTWCPAGFDPDCN